MTIELQNIILEMIARGEPLSATVERLCFEVEAMAPGAVCSVLLVDEGRLHPLADRLFRGITPRPSIILKSDLLLAPAALPHIWQHQSRSRI